MTITDILLILALAIFVIAWWARRTPARPVVLLLSALGALTAGVVGLLTFRWQDGVGVGVAALLLLVLLVNRLRKTDRRTGVPFVSGTLFALLVAVAVVAPIMFPVAPLPKPDGPNAVGVRSFEVDDASRPGVFAAKPGEPRRLLVRVWYPAGDTSGFKRRPYFTAPEARTTARTLGELVGFPPFFTYLRHVRTNSYEDAPLRAGAKALPVLIYSHGYTSFLGQNTVLMEHLASHGYVVFSLQHTYDSSATVFPSGEVAPADPALFKAMAEANGEGGKPPPDQVKAMGGRTLDERLDGFLRMRETAVAKDERLLRSGLVWAQDRVFLHDQLEQGAVPPAIRQILAVSDLQHVGEMGMSFGGATTGTVCMVDRRCAAGINLDGGDFPFQAFGREMPVPFLMFHSDLGNIARALGVKAANPPHSFNEFSYEAFSTAGTRPDVLRVQLKGAQHLGLSDFSLFVRRPLRDPLFGTTPTKLMIGAQNAFVRGFFDRYLKGVASEFPAPEEKTYAGWVTPVAGGGEVQRWWAAKSEADRAAIEARIQRARAAAALPASQPEG